MIPDFTASPISERKPKISAACVQRTMYPHPARSSPSHCNRDWSWVFNWEVQSWLARDFLSLRGHAQHTVFSSYFSSMRESRRPEIRPCVFVGVQNPRSWRHCSFKVICTKSVLISKQTLGNTQLFTHRWGLLMASVCDHALLGQHGLCPREDLRVSCSSARGCSELSWRFSK